MRSWTREIVCGRLPAKVELAADAIGRRQGERGCSPSCATASPHTPRALSSSHPKRSMAPSHPTSPSNPSTPPRFPRSTSRSNSLIGDTPTRLARLLPRRLFPFDRSIEGTSHGEWFTKPRARIADKDRVRLFPSRRALPHNPRADSRARAEHDRLVTRTRPRADPCAGAIRAAWSTRRG